MKIQKLKSKLPRNSSVTSISVDRYNEDGTKSKSSTKADCKRPLNQQKPNEAPTENSTANIYKDCATINTSAPQNTFSYEHNYRTPIIDYPQRDKKKMSAVLKRALLPHKTYYELEWAIPNYDNATTSKVWLQLDEQTSRGIDRVRRLGFNDLDVRLDDKLTEYMINSVNTKENIMIEILFSSGNYHDYRKDSVLQSSASDQRKTHLVRLRRVHWWVKDYNLARAHLP
ncbi:hypothetical protein INT48_003375 [Thamnidium elegans]|uniref:Uncharacterized protein n=1 Tax=Thamnidium elegans TaxID=101142 RepID=A0A8H7SMW6_9FUNG|nr:hypothetical protein INT48_003375 [Thamnidium elegans]